MSFFKLRATAIFLALTTAFSAAAFAPVAPLTANAATEPPVWKVLWLCYGSLNATITRGGSSRNYALTLSEGDKEIVASMPAKFKAYIERSANNNVSVSVDYVCPENPITSVSKVSPGDDSSFWVSPADVKADLDKYAPPGTYDSIIVTSRMDEIPRSYWGLAQGTSEMSNGAGYSFVAFLDGDISWYMTTTADNPYPEEVFVHEWLHQLEAFYRSNGYKFPGVDDSTVYGYKNALTIGYNGWHVYYGDIMKCKVYDSASKKYIGITPEMWRETPLSDLSAKAAAKEADKNERRPIDTQTASSWAKEGINAANSLGLVTAELRGDLTATTTRAEFCKAIVNFLEKYYDKPIATVLRERGLDPLTFADTKDSAIGAAAALGITSGTDTAKNLFNPNGELTREQAAAMLYNAAKVTGVGMLGKGVIWSDAKDISAWAKSAISTMYAIGVMGGTNTNPLTFSPKLPYTHEQSIVTLRNLWLFVKK